MRLAALVLVLAVLSGTAAAAAPPPKQVRLATAKVRLPPRGEVTLIRWSFDVERKDGEPVRRGLRIRIGAANAAKLPPSIIAVGAVEENPRRPGHFVALAAIANKRGQRSLSSAAAPDALDLIFTCLTCRSDLDYFLENDDYFVLPKALDKLKAQQANKSSEPPPALGQFLEPEGDERTAATLPAYEPDDAARLDAGPPVNLSPLRLLEGYVGIVLAAAGDKPTADAAFIRRFVDLSFAIKVAPPPVTAASATLDFYVRWRDTEGCPGAETIMGSVTVKKPAPGASAEYNLDLKQSAYPDCVQREDQMWGVYLHGTRSTPPNPLFAGGTTYGVRCPGLDLGSPPWPFAPCFRRLILKTPAG